MPFLPAAIGIILSADHTQVLLVKRRDVPVWVLPGGGIESYEKPEDAVIREVQEETGYQIQILRKCAEYSPVNRLTHFTSVFLCEIQAGQMHLTSETAAVAFHPLHQLPPSFFFPHAQWLNEALSQSALIQRPLTEISYLAIFQYFMKNPWQVLRFAWTRFFK